MKNIDLNKIKEFLKVNYFEINVFYLVLLIILILFVSRVWKLYYPQAYIVQHDYGQVFDSVADWKIYKIERGEKYGY